MQFRSTVASGCVEAVFLGRRPAEIESPWLAGLRYWPGAFSVVAAGIPEPGGPAGPRCAIHRPHSRHVAFSDIELADHLRVLEQVFWSRRRPPVQIRDQVREGQRITGHSIELFMVRPAWGRPGELREESIAKVQYVRTCDHWRLFWKRANGQWYRYEPCRDAPSLSHALQVIHEDAYQCFFG